MSPTVSTRMVLILVLVTCLTGVIDSAIGERWDAVALFTFAVALVTLLLIRYQGRRQALPLRSDLVAWLRQRAASTGEEPEVLADRAVAAYRAGLTRLEPPAS